LANCEEDAMSETKLGAGKRRRIRDQLRCTRDARLYRRLLAVLEYDRGESVSDIAELLGVSRQNIYNWIELAHERDDVVALRDAPRSGRPARADEVFDTLLRTLLMLSPERFGYHATYWTIALLQDQLRKNLGEDYSASTVRRGLQRLDYVWKRPRYVLAPDPQREKKNAQFAASSLACEGAASCWLRTRRICCCFRRCGRCGRSAASRRG
jgi:transposase